MSFEISRVDVWAGELEDRPGALASKLAHLMMRAQANLEFVIARPSQDKPGRSVLYVAPLVGEQQEEVAQEVGLRRSKSINALRLVGPDRPGLAAGIAGTLASADLNITGLTASATQGQAIVYVRCASAEEIDAAIEVLTPVLCEA